MAEIPQAAWDALVPEDAPPFVRWAWLNALEESGSVTAERGWQPTHFTLWEGARLVAAAPAYLKSDSHGEFVFDWAWANAAERAGIRYYPKLVLAVPLTPATGPRLLVAPDRDTQARAQQLGRAALDFARAEGLSSAHVLFPTEQEAGWLQEVGFAVRNGVQYHWRNRGYASFDDFLGRFRSSRRNQIRRERRGPAEQGIELRTLHGDALHEVGGETMHRLYASTVDRYLFGHRYLTRAFFDLALERLLPYLELVEARQQGRLVAGAFNVRSAKALYGRYWGCFEEHPFLHFNVCIYHPVEEAIRLGLERFEPGAGGEHKLTRGFEPSLTWSAHWIADARLDTAVRSFLTHERAAIEQGLPRWHEETGFRRDEG
jgi:predicted N-acyltransferase